MPKFTSQILLLFSKVLHLRTFLLKNFSKSGLKVVSLNQFTAAKYRFSFSMPKQP